MKLTLPYPPSLNKMYRTWKGRVLISEEGRGFKKRVWKVCHEHKVKPIMSGPVRIIIDAFRPQRRGDLDNIFKSLLDSLNNNLYRDDSQIVEIIARRHDDKDDPRVEVEVEAV